MGAAWFRTGDLGVDLDGELDIIGRIKDLIIVDGRNHYLEDIEATAVDASPAVRAGFRRGVLGAGQPNAGRATKNDTGERLIIVAERASGAGPADPQPVVDAIRAAVSRHHGLLASDVRLVAAGAIPRTTSGKLARRACRAQYLDGRATSASQATDRPPGLHAPGIRQTLLLQRELIDVEVALPRKSFAQPVRYFM